MVHDTDDVQVPAEQSRQMGSALKKAGKLYELVLIKDGTHQLNREPDRLTMLNALDRFLATNLGPGVTAPNP